MLGKFSNQASHIRLIPQKTIYLMILHGTMYQRFFISLGKPQWVIFHSLDICL